MIHRLAGGLAAVLLLLASCGEPSTPDRSAAGSGDGVGVLAPAYPLTLSTPNGKVTIEQRPTRIVSLSPTATEMLFAIGAGDQVIAVDDQSNFPPEAPTTDLSGFEPNVEAIASYEPDLVVYATEPGDLAPSLESLGITTLLQPAAGTLRDVYREIIQLGLATGNVAEAKTLADRMKDEIASIADGIDPHGPRLTFYHELDDTYYSVTSSTFIGQLYSLVGLTNIADRARGAGGGYPQLSAEYIIDADPDLIFLADTKCCGQSALTVAKRAGWDRIAAVERGHVILLDDDVASRWGPRIVDYLRRIAAALADAQGEEAA